jgi:hypothetical protein
MTRIVLLSLLLLSSTVLFATPGASACAAADPTVDFVVCVYVPYCTGGSTIKDEGGRLVTCVEYLLP